jgi:hypothetical protein
VNRSFLSVAVPGGFFLNTPLVQPGEIEVETSKIESENVEKTVAMAAKELVRDLNELQLAYVGGGIADVVFG